VKEHQNTLFTQKLWIKDIIIYSSAFKMTLSHSGKDIYTTSVNPWQ